MSEEKRDDPADEQFQLRWLKARQAELENTQRALAAARALCGEAAERIYDQELAGRLRAEAAKGGTA